jgi:hypothetical protein
MASGPKIIRLLFMLDELTSLNYHGSFKIVSYHMFSSHISYSKGPKCHTFHSYNIKKRKSITFFPRQKKIIRQSNAQLFPAFYAIQRTRKAISYIPLCLSYRFSAASLKTLRRLTAAPPMPAAVRLDVHLFFFSRSSSLLISLTLEPLPPFGLLDVGVPSTGVRWYGCGEPAAGGIHIGAEVPCPCPGGMLYGDGMGYWEAGPAN